MDFLIDGFSIPSINYKHVLCNSKEGVVGICCNLPLFERCFNQLFCNLADLIGFHFCRFRKWNHNTSSLAETSIKAKAKVFTRLFVWCACFHCSPLLH